jgi:2-polyprenyl-3-methyl-5-hydroxy-6-metoxy-1,4-benzoquinol methylase
MPARTDASEILDNGAYDVDELLENHRDMARVNRWLGGAQLTIRGIQRLTGHLRPGDHLTILDAGTGMADIPRAVDAWARDSGIELQSIGVDIDRATLHAARDSDQRDAVRFLVADCCRLPLRDDSVDVAVSSMTLHHLTDEQAIVALGEMARVARLGIVVNDLTRSLHGLAGAWLLSRLTTRNRLTRHDAPLSVRRARTAAEMADLARAAGLRAPVFDSALGYRVAMTAGVRPW